MAATVQEHCARRVGGATEQHGRLEPGAVGEKSGGSAGGGAAEAALTLDPPQAWTMACPEADSGPWAGHVSPVEAVEP